MKYVKYCIERPDTCEGCEELTNFGRGSKCSKKGAAQVSTRVPHAEFRAEHRRCLFSQEDLRGVGQRLPREEEEARGAVSLDNCGVPGADASCTRSLLRISARLAGGSFDVGAKLDAGEVQRGDKRRAVQPTPGFRAAAPGQREMPSRAKAGVTPNRQTCNQMQ